MSIPAVPSNVFKNFMKVGRMIPMLAMGLLFTPQFAFAASSGGFVTSAGPLSGIALLNQNILSDLVRSKNFGLGMMMYAAIVRLVTHFPVEWLSHKWSKPRINPLALSMILLIGL